MLLVTAEEMREIDKQTIEGIGIPGVVLMENAGAKVADKVIEVIGNNKRARIIILAGHGNNGGDGFVVARYLGNQGYQVETWLVGDIRKCSKESQIHFHALVHAGYKLKFWNEQNDFMLKENINKAEIIIDALLGTGGLGILKEPLHDIINFANQTNAIRIAVDMPTGVNSNTGQVANIAYSANMTVTFGLPKIGQFLYPGAEYVGKLVIADISIPPIVINTVKLKNKLITHDMVKKMLPNRSLNTHKGTYGHVLIIGGSKDMPGAPLLASLAAMRSGAGLTTLAVPKSVKNLIFSRIPEALCIGLTETESGNFSLESTVELDLDNKKITAIAIGPGLGRWNQESQWLEEILKISAKPVVIDADGLNILANNLNLLLARKHTTILTPHPGEMARLINKDINYVEENRVSVAREFAENYKVFVILKGANTIIATPGGEVFFNTTGGPELAKGGSGDVLTGIIAGFLAQKIPNINAIILGVYLHGLAGSFAGAQSIYSVLGTDIIENIGRAINHTMSNHAE